jgi:hypothetical protein
MNMVDKDIVLYNNQEEEIYGQEEGDRGTEENDDEKERENDDVDDDYFFPSPEEVEEARAPIVGMSFPTLEEAHICECLWATNRICSHKRKKLQGQGNNTSLQQIQKAIRGNKSNKEKKGMPSRDVIVK